MVCCTRSDPFSTSLLMIFSFFISVYFRYKVKLKVALSCLTVCDPMDYTDHGIFQARILEWVAFPFSRGSSQPRDQTQVSHIAGRFFTSWDTRETPFIIKKQITFKELYTFFFFLPHHVACEISVLQARIKSIPPALEARTLNHSTVREVPSHIYIYLTLVLNVCPHWGWHMSQRVVMCKIITNIF